MTDGTPGWFRDPSDPSVARWHDGDKWTEHTLVIADQTPGVEPAPPVIAPVEAPASTEPEFQIPRHPASGGGRLAGLPVWAKIGGPIAVVALVILAFVVTSSGGSKKNDNTNTVGTQAVSLDTAIAAARKAGLADTITDSTAGPLITRICSAATHPDEVDQLARDLGQLPATSATDVRATVSALGAGAQVECRSTMDSHPDLLSGLQDQAAIAFSTTTTSPTVAGGTDTGTTVAGTGSSTTVKGKTGTTVKGATTTTAKATTTTTAKPLPQVLPNTACSPEGASGQNKITHAPLTCQKQCIGSKTVWSSGTCPTQPTAPPTTAGSGTNTSVPTPTTATTSANGTTGGL